MAPLLALLCLVGTAHGFAGAGMSFLENVGRTCSLKDDKRPCGAGATCTPCVQRQNVDVVTDSERQCERGTQGECIPCMQGDYCPRGSRNPALWTAMHICPAGSFCANSTSKEDCSPGYFCPQGLFTYNETLLDEVNATVECPARKGLYCPPGSKEFLNGCPAGFYCPTPSEKIACPEGHYCRDFSISPRKCPLIFTQCPAGSKAPGQPWAMVVGVVVCTALFFSVYFHCLRSRQRKERRERAQAIISSKIASSAREVMGRLIGIPSYALPEKVPGFHVKKVPITVEFESLRLAVKSQKSPVLNDVTAKFMESQVTAIMGPSGCGKSSLLNTVSGRAHYGRVSGTILVNGREGRMAALQRETAFVPQDDTVFAELTVRENLHYSGCLRLGREVGHEGRSTIIGGILQVLGMEHIQHTVVGDVKRRGISGGQKKRVNIGMELVADPTLVFLDEPTSGLGATDTLVVMKALRSMAFLRRTVVAVIHQPRYEVFALFHEVLLLAVGGFTVYFGDSALALEYFEAMGFKLPLYANPADFFLDIIAGNAQRRDNTAFKPSDLVAMWQLQKDTIRSAQVLSVDEVQLPADLELKIKREWDLVDTDGSGEIASEELHGMLNELGVSTSQAEAELLIQALDEDGSGKLEYHEFLALARKEYAMLKFNTYDAGEEGGDSTEGEVEEGGGGVGGAGRAMKALTFKNEKRLSSNARTFKKLQTSRRAAGFFTQTRYFLMRAGNQLMRTISTGGLWDILLILLAALVVGAITGNDWKMSDIPKDALLSTVTLGVLTTVSALKLFGEEATMREREARFGLSTLAYFLAKNCVHLLDVVVQPSMYTAIYFSFLMPDTTFRAFWVVGVAVSWACAGLGQLFSVMLQPGAALLAAVMFPLIAGVFLGGVDPAYNELSWAMRKVTALSYSRWAVETFVILEMDEQDSFQTERVEMLYDRFGFEKKDYWFNLASLFVMGAVWRLLAYVVMTGVLGPVAAAIIWVVTELLVEDDLSRPRPSLPAAPPAGAAHPGGGNLLLGGPKESTPRDLEAGGGGGEEDDDARLKLLMRTMSKKSPGTKSHQAWEQSHVDRILARNSSTGSPHGASPGVSSATRALPAAAAAAAAAGKPRVGAQALASMEDEMRMMEQQLHGMKSGAGTRKTAAIAAAAAAGAAAAAAPPIAEETSTKSAPEAAGEDESPPPYEPSDSGAEGDVYSLPPPTPEGEGDDTSWLTPPGGEGSTSRGKGVGVSSMRDLFGALSLSSSPASPAPPAAVAADAESSPASPDIKEFEVVSEVEVDVDPLGSEASGAGVDPGEVDVLLGAEPTGGAWAEEEVAESATPPPVASLASPASTAGAPVEGAPPGVRLGFESTDTSFLLGGSSSADNSFLYDSPAKPGPPATPPAAAAGGSEAGDDEDPGSHDVFLDSLQPDTSFLASEDGVPAGFAVHSPLHSPVLSPLSDGPSVDYLEVGGGGGTPGAASDVVSSLEHLTGGHREAPLEAAIEAATEAVGEAATEAADGKGYDMFAPRAAAAPGAGGGAEEEEGTAPPPVVEPAPPPPRKKTIDEILAESRAATARSYDRSAETEEAGALAGYSPQVWGQRMDMPAPSQPERSKDRVGGRAAASSASPSIKGRLKKMRQPGEGDLAAPAPPPAAAALPRTGNDGGGGGEDELSFDVVPVKSGAGAGAPRAGARPGTARATAARPPTARAGATRAASAASSRGGAAAPAPAAAAPRARSRTPPGGAGGGRVPSYMKATAASKLSREREGGGAPTAGPSRSTLSPPRPAASPPRRGGSGSGRVPSYMKPTTATKARVSTSTSEDSMAFETVGGGRGGGRAPSRGRGGPPGYLTGTRSSNVRASR